MVVDGRGKSTHEVALTVLHGDVGICRSARRLGTFDPIDRRSDFCARRIGQMCRGQVFIRDGHFGFGDLDPFGVDRVV